MERKIYFSFHDIPFSEYNYSYPSKPPLTSKTEIIHLGIAMIVLSVAFAFAMAEGIFGLIYSNDPLGNILYYLQFSSLGILTGFFFHELSHKLMARRYGLWAEFRMFSQGLMLALIFGIFFGFVIAAPGAVNVWGGARRFEFGRIAAAGPLANIVIGALAMLGYIELGLDSFYGSVLGFICMVNVFLAFFNLIPFGPLDGRKIIAWNSIVWAIMFIISIFLLVVYMGRGIVIPGF